MKRKPTTVFRIHTGYTSSSRNYMETTIRIQPFNRIRLSEQIAKCLENPDYYGKPEKWQALEKAGYKFYYEAGFSAHDFTLSYLHTDHDGNAAYCSHKISSLDGDLRGLQWTTKLLIKASREIAKSQDRYYGPGENYSSYLNKPAEVVAALKKMKAVEIEFVSPSGNPLSFDSEAVEKTSAPHQFFGGEVTA